MIELPSLERVLEVTEEIDNELCNLGNKPLFPFRCFETSLLIFSWIKSQDKNILPKLQGGAYINNNGNKDFHIWVEYNKKIIDYTAIQFKLGTKATTLDKLKKKYDLSKIPYKYELNNKSYSSETVYVPLIRPMIDTIEYIISNYSFMEFEEFAYIYIKEMINLVKQYTYNETFGLLPCTYEWCKNYDRATALTLKRKYNIPDWA
ncbi:hypothetical protein AB2T85_17755 [Clostridium butyricum]|uniref:hypothetical protein n=1 Tax=Clostridium butyricum TaxID=1492 RepID=UPI003467EADE